jgi:hypothetical protein
MVFPPNLNTFRSLEKFAREDVILLMNNYPSHIGEVILPLLQDVRICIITEPPHTMQIFQEFNISLFGVLKQQEQYRLSFDEDDVMALVLPQALPDVQKKKKKKKKQ